MPQNFVRYYAHGSAVHGHELGFLKRKGDCEKDYMFMVWSSYEDMKRLEGEMIPIQLVNNKDAKGGIKLPLEKVSKLGVGEVGYFGGVGAGLIATDRLIDFLKNSSELEVRILGTEDVSSSFDIQEDSFDTSNFTGARSKAESLCVARQY